MKVSVGPVVLYNRHTLGFEEAHVFQGMDQKNYDDFEQQWQPLLTAHRGQFAGNVAACAGNFQDSHWDWIVESSVANRTLGYDTFALECAGQTQALMVVDSNQFALHPTQTGKELVHIARLATAPWNRAKTVPHPKYKGAGRILVATAISLSIELEFGGRIGLHALPHSEEWYRYCGFLEVLDPNPNNTLKYFEMTADTAAKFLQEGE